MSKKQKKEHQQKAWGLLVSGHIPLILLHDEVDHRIHQIVLEIVDGIAAIGLQIAVVIPKHAEHKKLWQAHAEKHPKWVKIIESHESKLPVFDMTILEDVTIERLKELRDVRMVPVAEKGVSTFDPIEEKGNGFLFHQNAWSLFAALVRAQETYRFPYDWDNVIRGKSSEKSSCE